MLEEKIEMQTHRITDAKINLEQNHQKMQTVFDEFFETVHSEQTRVGEKVLYMDHQLTEKFEAMKEFSKKIQKVMDGTVSDIFHKNSVDEKKFDNYDRRFKLIDV